MCGRGSWGLRLKWAEREPENVRCCQPAVSVAPYSLSLSCQTCLTKDIFVIHEFDADLTDWPR